MEENRTLIIDHRTKLEDFAIDAYTMVEQFNTYLQAIREGNINVKRDKALIDDVLSECSEFIGKYKPQVNYE